MSTLLSIRGKTPQIAEGAFVADTARLIGDVRLAPKSSIWYGAVLRGDLNRIEVGEGSNLQDNTVVHLEDDVPCIVGKEVVVGHCAMLHGTTIGDGSLVGIGAILLTGSKIGPGSLIGASTLVPEGMEIPPGKLVLGTPAKIIRDLTAEEQEMILGLARKYQGTAREFIDAGHNGA